MKKKKEIRNIYINIFVVSFLMLVTLIFFFVMVFTKGDLNTPIVIDIDQDSSGISGDTITVDDKVRDYYYYKGLNYTEPQNLSLPSGDDQNIYPDSKLLDINITYQSNDVNNNLDGYVSLSERQKKYIYRKYIPINDNGTTSLDDDYVLIELIENPFTDRPTDRGFNGWYTNYLGVNLIYDNLYYIRYAKVPVTYQDGFPNKINIEFNASWTHASVAYLNNNWATAFNELKDKQMQEITVYHTQVIYPDLSGYYKERALSWRQSCAYLYDVNGNE